MTISVWMAPKINNTNKYNQLFSSSIENNEFIVNHYCKKDLLKPKKGDIVHFHWISTYYQSNVRIIMIIKSIIFTAFLHYLRIRKIKIVWTVHNLYPHDSLSLVLEKKIRRRVMLLSDRLIVASNSIKKDLINEFDIDDTKIDVILHGHYKDAYPSNNINFRLRYGIGNEKCIFLFVGTIMDYKNIPSLVSSYMKIRTSNTHLIIAGKVNKLMTSIVDKFPKEKDITYDFRFIPDEELVDLIRSSNFVVLPYKEITTSGTAILAVSLKRKVICPRIAFIEEYLDSNLSIMYNDNNPNNLTKALEKCFNMSDEISERYYAEFIEKLSWSRIGSKMRIVYRSILS